jgi:hypothetical protein
MSDKSYIDKGYEGREDYLECLASVFELPYKTVKAIADTLGEDEDFKDLIKELQDYKNRSWDCLD